MAYDTTKYNGWTNYATWRINLEILGNLDLAEFITDKPDLSDAADWCKCYVDDILDECGRGLALDYAYAFISDVNWREIAEYLLNDASYPEGESE